MVYLKEPVITMAVFKKKKKYKSEWFCVDISNIIEVTTFK